MTSERCGDVAQDARGGANEAAVSAKLNEFEAVLEQYVSALMALAHVHWDKGEYSTVLAVLTQAREFASGHAVWKLNIAHTHFMMVRTRHDARGCRRSNGARCYPSHWARGEHRWQAAHQSARKRGSGGSAGDAEQRHGRERARQLPPRD